MVLASGTYVALIPTEEDIKRLGNPDAHITLKYYGKAKRGYPQALEFAKDVARHLSGPKTFKTTGTEWFGWRNHVPALTFHPEDFPGVERPHLTLLEWGSFDTVTVDRVRLTTPEGHRTFQLGTREEIHD